MSKPTRAVTVIRTGKPQRPAESGHRVRAGRAAVGSVLDLAPRADYGCYLSAASFQNRMEQVWGRVGTGIAKAADRWVKSGSRNG